MKNLKNRLIVFILFLTSVFAIEITSINNSIGIGYDSNPIRLSDNEINQVESQPNILSNAKYVHSRFINLKTSLNFESNSLSSFGKKTFYKLSLSHTSYIDVSKKTNNKFLFQLNEKLGKYRSFYINYFIMPNFYLREYKDGDLIIDFSDIEDNLQSAKFSIEKIGLAYQFPVIKNNIKSKVGLSKETQLFDKYFTEFDLNIRSAFIQFNFNTLPYSDFMIYYSYQDADNFTYQDGNITTESMDRGYFQDRIKFSFKRKIQKKKSIGFIVDNYLRRNNSQILNDELHYKREHSDLTLSLWAKFNSQKITFSFRKRVTKSPDSWVESLKTFERYIITYNIYLDKIKL